VRVVSRPSQNATERASHPDSCGGTTGCRAVVTVKTDGTYELNQECASRRGPLAPSAPPACADACAAVYAMAQASKAIVPKDVGGPFVRRPALLWWDGAG
jgi:hypothetical protein